MWNICWKRVDIQNVKNVKRENDIQYGKQIKTQAWHPLCEIQESITNLSKRLQNSFNQFSKQFQKQFRKGLKQIRNRFWPYSSSWLDSPFLDPLGKRPLLKCGPLFTSNIWKQFQTKGFHIQYAKHFPKTKFEL